MAYRCRCALAFLPSHSNSLSRTPFPTLQHVNLHRSYEIYEVFLWHADGYGKKDTMDHHEVSVGDVSGFGPPDCFNTGDVSGDPPIMRGGACANAPMTGQYVSITGQNFRRRLSATTAFNVRRFALMRHTLRVSSLFCWCGFCRSLECQASSGGYGRSLGSGSVATDQFIICDVSIMVKSCTVGKYVSGTSCIDCPKGSICPGGYVGVATVRGCLLLRAPVRLAADFCLRCRGPTAPWVGTAAPSATPTPSVPAHVKRGTFVKRAANLQRRQPAAPQACTARRQPHPVCRSAADSTASVELQPQRALRSNSASPGTCATTASGRRVQRGASLTHSTFCLLNWWMPVALSYPLRLPTGVPLARSVQACAQLAITARWSVDCVVLCCSPLPSPP